MHLVTRTASLLAVVVALCAAVPAARASTEWGRILAPRSETVLAGTTTEIRWTSLPEDIDEFELLLSLDDGRSFTVRLTPQLDPGVGTYVWRVPNLPASRARLRLRVGRDGREVEGPPGNAFAIARDSRLPGSGLEHRAGEWWPVAASQAVATWIASDPEGVETREAAEVPVADAWLGPKDPVPLPAPQGAGEILPVGIGNPGSAARPGPGRPVPEPHLRP